MKTKWAITTLFILAVVIVSNPAFANTYGNSSGHYFGNDRYNDHFNGDRYNHYFGGGHTKGYSGNHRYKHHYGHRRYKHYYRPHRYYRHRYNHNPYPFYGAFFWSPPPPPPSVYIYRQYPPTIIYREKYAYDSQQSDYLPAKNSKSSTDTSCLQTREYTATMVIEGETVEAYGTKCLQPDGSWRYGPAQPVPNS